MSDMLRLIALPVGLGLFGFVEPCSIGASLLFIKSLEGKDRRDKIMQSVIFTLLRGLLMGGLGVAAVAIGARFFEFQKIAWIAFGSVYIVIGFFYVFGKAGLFRLSFGPRLSSIRGTNRSLALGTIFAFNIPACAGPLLVILLGMSAASGAVGTSLAKGFLSMALFGLALSLPIVAATFFTGARRFLDKLSGWSSSMPRWTGIVLILLGLWSIRFGMVAQLGIN